MRHKAKPVPSQKELHRLLDYRDGVLYWNTDVSYAIKKGMKAGWRHPYGYQVIGINRTQYRAHRLVYAYFNNDLNDHPYLEIDHIDGDRSNDRIDNLRLVSREVNARNRQNNKGYHQPLGSQKYRVCITAYDTTVHVGMYSTPEEARQASLLAKSLFVALVQRTLSLAKARSLR